MGDLLANGSLGIEGPAPFAFGQLEIVRPAEYAAADLPAASSPARSIGLSSTDNETAHRLLTSVFPDGVVL